MSVYSDDLLRAASRLYTRRKGQKGPLKGAYIRRSISTTYYALFHFLLDDASTRIVGSRHDLRHRRRLFIRTFSHTGLTTAFGKLRGAMIDASAADFFRLPTSAAAPVPTPPFLRNIATAYLDARAKREDADYNLNEPLAEIDARQLHRRVRRAIKAWDAANTPSDRDVKHTVALFLSVKGQLKS